VDGQQVLDLIRDNLSQEDLEKWRDFFSKKWGWSHERKEGDSTYV
jgi:hypothetical protein